MSFTHRNPSSNLPPEEEVEERLCLHACLVKVGRPLPRFWVNVHGRIETYHCAFAATKRDHWRKLSPLVRWNINANIIGRNHSNQAI